jgi:2-keto-4-pentenoate hydratase/2-oxohepta-3-ene-1,7-dioic acid hydratase in catechol pathway
MGAVAWDERPRTIDIPGVGRNRDPKIFMRAGDRIEVEIERIGVLSNPVVAA